MLFYFIFIYIYFLDHAPYTSMIIHRPKTYNMKMLFQSSCFLPHHIPWIKKFKLSN